MVERLVDSYPIGAQVEIWLRSENEWRPGEVVRHEHPGVWVETQVGGHWFVTNRRRIRLRESPEA